MRALYQGVFDRRPDTAGYAYWAARLDAGASTEALAAILARSAEGRAATVGRAYQRALERPPGPADSTYWSGQLRRTTPEVIRARLLAAPEVAAAAGGYEPWVRRALWIALEREPDAASLDYWKNPFERRTPGHFSDSASASRTGWKGHRER